MALAYPMIAADLASEGVREGLFAARVDVADVRLNDDFFCILPFFFVEFGKWDLMLKVPPGEVIRCFYMAADSKWWMVIRVGI